MGHWRREQRLEIDEAVQKAMPFSGPNSVEGGVGLVSVARMAGAPRRLLERQAHDERIYYPPGALAFHRAFGTPHRTLQTGRSVSG